MFTFEEGVVRQEQDKYPGIRDRPTPLQICLKLFLLSSESTDMFIDGVYVGVHLHHLHLRVAYLRGSFVRLNAKTLYIRNALIITLRGNVLNQTARTVNVLASLTRSLT